MEIILNNVAEPHDEFVLTMSDLKELLESSEKINAYCGYEPSGPIHLGYFPSIQKAIELSRIGDVNILLADYHAYLNNKGPIDLIQDLALNYWIPVFRCLGVNKARFVLGSEFQLSNTYIHDLFAVSRFVSTTRAIRSVSMILRSRETIPVSATIYPLMQVLDIFHLEINLAFGGTDQRKIHALVRDLIRNDISKELHYKPRKVVAIHLPMVVGLKHGEKMSSSKPDTHIAIHDTPQTIIRKIKSAYCPPKDPDPDNNPIFSILKYIVFPYSDFFYIDRPEKFGGPKKYYSFREISEDYVKGKLHPLDIKNSLADWLIKKIEPIHKLLERDPSILLPVYNLQKWNYEHGYISKESWKLLATSYSNWIDIPR